MCRAGRTPDGLRRERGPGRTCVRHVELTASLSPGPFVSDTHDVARSLAKHVQLLTQGAALCYKLGDRLVVRRRESSRQPINSGLELRLVEGGANGGANGTPIRRLSRPVDCRFDLVFSGRARSDSNGRPAT
jgi:hypothetical protein